MHVRNSAKAIVLREGKILVNRCISKYGEYYSLPGGGQLPGEMLSETVRRELMEETGCVVTPLRLAGIYERISPRRENEMSHKIYFIFLCRLDEECSCEPTEQDRFQIGMEWLELKDIKNRNLFPRAIRENIEGLLAGAETIFIGSEKRK